MEYTTYPGTDWQISRVGLGCWALGGQFGPVDEAEADRIVHTALDEGITLFDTADAYGVEMGTSERRLGRALAGKRTDVLIATKVGNWGRRFGVPLPYTDPLHVINCCHASLYRLRTDSIDFYQCHISNLQEPDVFLEAFAKLKKDGAIRAYGISTNDPEVLRRFNREEDCAVCQLDYSLTHTEPEADILPYCQQHQIGTLIRGPLDKGILTGKFDRDSRFDDSVRSSWNEGQARERFLSKLDRVDRVRKVADAERPLAETALRFCLSHPAVTTIIPGARTADQVRHNARAGAGALPEDELSAIRSCLK